MTLLALVMLSSTALAASVDAMSASPDAPAVEFGWRGSLRAKAGVRIPFVSPSLEERGALFEVPAFIELHNAPGNGSFVPWELWRARITLGGGYRWRLGDFTLDGLLFLEHESDHATAPNAASEQGELGFFNLNSLALTARGRRLVRHPQFAQLTARLHVLTCTVSHVICGEGFGLRGDPGFEASAELGQVFDLDQASRWALFVSLSGDVLAGGPLILPARRVSARAGVTWKLRVGVFSLSLFGLAGTDVGYVRGPDTLQGGVQLGWTLGD